MASTSRVSKALFRLIRPNSKNLTRRMVRNYSTSRISPLTRNILGSSSEFNCCCLNSTLVSSHLGLGGQSRAYSSRDFTDWDDIQLDMDKAKGEAVKPDFGQYEIVVPGKFKMVNFVPEDIHRPDYFRTGSPKAFRHLPMNQRTIKTEDQVERFRSACKLARETLLYVSSHVKVGITTEELDNIAHRFILKNKAYPSPLNYRGFPKSICTSVNNVAIHGIPDDRALVDGDIINVDVTVFYQGYHGDCSETICVGNVDPPGVRLVEATRDAMEIGIYACGPGIPLNSIGTAIEGFADMKKYTVIPVITGHGIGQFFHGEPDIFHVAYPYIGYMEAGMAFTIEPVLTQGGEEIKTLKDGWTTVTEDDARTAQFEQTILITDNGFEILTKI